MGAIRGSRIIYLYRILKDAATDNATALAFTTENGRTQSRDADTTETKDGPIRTPGALESEITTTAIFSNESDAMINKLETALNDSDKVEVWEVNLDKPGETENEGKYAAKYFQGYVTEFELTSTAEDHAEASLTFGLEGKGADGYATVTDEQQEIASYVFADTAKTGA